MANKLLIFTAFDNKQLVQALIYLLCIAATITLVVAVAPEVYALIMADFLSAILGWLVIIALGVFLGYLLNLIVLSFLDHKDKAVYSPTMPLSHHSFNQATVSAPVASAQFYSAPHSVSTSIAYPQIEAEDPQPVKLELSVNSLTLHPRLQNFRSYSNLIFLFGMDRRLIYLKSLKKNKDKKDTKAIQPFLVTFPENESDNKRKDVQIRQARVLASMPSIALEELILDKNNRQLVSQLINVDDEMDSFIELNNGRLLAKEHYQGCQLVLPLPEGKYTGRGNQFITFTQKNAHNESARLERWDLQEEKPTRIKAWAVEGFIYALIYLKENLFVSIEDNEKYELSIQIWEWDDYNKRKIVAILPESEHSYRRAPIELLALHDGSFLTFGCWHGIQHWSLSQEPSKCLKLISKVLVAPDASKINRYGPLIEGSTIKITLLKFGYLAYYNEDKPTKIIILDLYAINKKYLVQEFYPYQGPLSREIGHPHGKFCSTIRWKDYLLVSQLAADDELCFYSLAKLMQGRPEKIKDRQEVTTALQGFITNGPAGIVEEYWDDEFDRPPPTYTRQW